MNIHIDDTNDSTIFDALQSMLPKDVKIEDVDEALDHILFANQPISFWFKDTERRKKLIVDFMMNRRPPENKVDLSIFDFSFLN